MYRLSIGPTVSKVVENQKEKVLAVPEVNTILYFPLIKHRQTARAGLISYFSNKKPQFPASFTAS